MLKTDLYCRDAKSGVIWRSVDEKENSNEVTYVLPPHFFLMYRDPTSQPQCVKFTNFSPYTEATHSKSFCSFLVIRPILPR